MQCASCYFENMPGVAVCGQCGANLQLALTPLDVNPPRARGWKKHLRRRLPIRQLSYRWRNYFGALAHEFKPRFISERADLPILLRTIVPGWAQMALGRAALGRAMMGLYLVMLLLTLLFFGSDPGAIFLGLALSIHASSIIDVVWTGIRDYKERFLTAIISMFAVGAICYFPIVVSISRIEVSRNILTDYGPFQRGDVLIYSPAAYWFHEPAVGDVVFYTIAPANYSGGFHVEYRIEGGELIDRIIAREGQTIEWENQTLRVDGQVSNWQPLNPDRIIPNLNIQVPVGYYCILPSMQPFIVQHVPAGVLQRLSLVPRYMILGRVLVRNYPFSRWWWIR